MITCVILGCGGILFIVVILGIFMFIRSGQISSEEQKKEFDNWKKNNFR